MADQIDATNLNSLSSCDLNTKFNDKCHVDWAPSNLISIVSLTGVYILKPQLDNQQGQFQIELIRNPVRRFKHQIESPSSRPDGNLHTLFDDVWQLLDSKQYMDVYLDPALMTNLTRLSSEAYPRRFRMAKWSPLLDVYPKQCFLAVLTVDYQLLIYARVNGLWTPRADLSRDYDRLWAQMNHERLATDSKANVQQPPSCIDFEAIKGDLHSLSFCNICWKETRASAGPLLLAATIPGDIVIWQMVKVTTQAGVSMQEAGNQRNSPDELQLEVKMILRTGMSYISSMSLFDDLLIASARGGQVVLYDLTVNFEQLNEEARGDESRRVHQGSGDQSTQPVKTLSLITLPPTAILWHCDNIEVADFCIQPISADTFRIVLAKSTNICWSMINYVRHAGSEQAMLAISDSFSAVDGLDPDVFLNQTPASWLKAAGNRRAVLIADDGSFFVLEFTDDRQDSTPKFDALRTGRLDLTRMVPRGLCSSPNGQLITMISSISLIYEPTKILAPTKVVLVPTTSDKKSFAECVEKITDEQWLASQRIESPMGVCDFLDYLRSLYPQLTSEQFQQHFKALRETLISIGLPANDSQLVRMKIVAFLLAKLIANSNHAQLALAGHLRGDRIDFDTQLFQPILLYEINQTLTQLFVAQTSDTATTRGAQESVSANADGAQSRSAAATRSRDLSSISTELASSAVSQVQANSSEQHQLVALSNEQVNSLRNYQAWLSQPDSSGNAALDERKRQVLEVFKENFKFISSKYAKTKREVCSICQSQLAFTELRIATCLKGHTFVRCAKSLLVIDPECSHELICEHCNHHYLAQLVWPTQRLWLCSFCQ